MRRTCERCGEKLSILKLRDSDTVCRQCRKEIAQEARRANRERVTFRPRHFGIW